MFVVWAEANRIIFHDSGTGKALDIHKIEKEILHTIPITVSTNNAVWFGALILLRSLRDTGEHEPYVREVPYCTRSIRSSRLNSNFMHLKLLVTLTIWQLGARPKSHHIPICVPDRRPIHIVIYGKSPNLKLVHIKF